MLEIEWSTDENFTGKVLKGLVGAVVKEAAMFHGTIDLLGSSDDESGSEPGDPPRRTPPARVNEDVEAEVRLTVQRLTDFVVRSCDFPDPIYDPDEGAAEPVTAVKRENTCNKPHCGKGCLCSSLRGLFPRGLTHCGKERCMLDCGCLERGLATADDENHYSDKSKRKKKLPTRFKDVVLGKAYKKLHAKTIYNSIAPEESTSDSEDNEGRLLSLQSPEKLKLTAPSSKMPSPELKKDGLYIVPTKAAPKRNDSAWAYDKIGPIKKTLQERRIGFVTNTMSDEQTLADVFIWCSLHNKYSCLCINYVFYSKHNSLLWKPSRESRYLANKVMFDIKLKEPTPITYEVYPFDLEMYSARTVGTLLDYRARNKDEVFTTKRKAELEHKVGAYSNSYVKFKKYLVIKRPEPPVTAEPRWFESEESYGVPGRIVNIVKTAEKWKVDVGEEDVVEGPVVDIELDEEIEENDAKSVKTVTKVSGRKRKPTMKMLQLEEMRRLEQLGRDFAEEEVDTKRPRKPKPLSSEGRVEETPLSSVKTEVKQESEEAIICAPDISHMFVPPEDPQSRAKSPGSPPPQSELSSQSDDDESVDLEGDDLDSIHSSNVLILKPRRDGYPHLGLMCLTPGIGYMTVLESLPGRIVLADPARPGIRRTFECLQDINVWLNAYLRSLVAFEPADLMLRWILVKPEVLRAKQIPKFELVKSDDVVLTVDGLSRNSHPSDSALPKLVPNPKCSAARRASDDSSHSSGEFSLDTADGCVTVQRLPPSTHHLDRRRHHPALPAWTPRTTEVDLHHQVTIRPLSALGPPKPPTQLYHHIQISK